MPVIIAERTDEDICKEKLKGTATTSGRVGKKPSDEIICLQIKNRASQKKSLCIPELKETEHT